MLQTVAQPELYSTLALHPLCIQPDQVKRLQLGELSRIHLTALALRIQLLLFRQALLAEDVLTKAFLIGSSVAVRRDKSLTEVTLDQVGDPVV